VTYLSIVDLDPADRYVRLVKSALTDAMRTDIDRSQGIYTIEGMSGARYRHFINALVRSFGLPGYLEVGSWMGSTLCAAIHGNTVRALAIDNWSQFGGPKDAFLENVARFRTPGATVSFLEGDFRDVAFDDLAVHLPPFDIYLFDGPHEEMDQYDGLIRALPVLADAFVFICDDWNWAQVRSGTHRAIIEAGLELVYVAEIRTSLDNSHGELRFKESDWHNGYFIAVLRKSTPGLSRPADA
jgi:hypothetical protein